MKINENLNSVIKFLSGGVAYSLVDKLVNYPSGKADEAVQAIRDQKLDNIQSDVNLLGNFVKDNLKVIKECREAYGNRNNVVIARVERDGPPPIILGDEIESSLDALPDHPRSGP